MNGNDKVPYICGPLTELPLKRQISVKRFYESIANAWERKFGKRPFVPHEHYDPQKHAHYTPAQVYEAEREQVCERTSLLIVVAVGPSWGGGIEVEMAYESDVPAAILCEREKLRQRKISRLLRGNPAIKYTIDYESEEEAIRELLEKFSTVSAKN
ncbi:MAG: hypothetical protein WC514_02425 [Candidatus Paceibacterota bacterium]